MSRSPWWAYHQGVALHVRQKTTDASTRLYSIRRGRYQAYVTLADLTPQWRIAYARWFAKRGFPEEALALDGARCGVVLAAPELTQ